MISNPNQTDLMQSLHLKIQKVLYCVSSLGVTDVRSKITTDISSMVDLVREVTDVPVAAGFGVSTPEQAKKMASQSDGAIVGRAIIKIIEKYGKDAPQYVEAYVKEMVDALK
ncbi:tryptophan synthase subunit alpha [Catenibacterium mitsuokai]|uniref:tryptophan synthase subunit alpha n=1 Tax=Catenibacterium mitsuokai TaxID=100886 RepID=UPI0022E16283|nr:tryptophan synthase subunit alpha [Catenibacterium mitsuokai]